MFFSLGRPVEFVCYSLVKGSIEDQYVIHTESRDLRIIWCPDRELMHTSSEKTVLDKITYETTTLED